MPYYPFIFSPEPADSICNRSTEGSMEFTFTDNDHEQQSSGIDKWLEMHPVTTPCCVSFFSTHKKLCPTYLSIITVLFLNVCLLFANDYR